MAQAVADAGVARDAVVLDLAAGTGLLTRRLTAYLMRKGYSGSAVRTAVRSALSGSGLR